MGRHTSAPPPDALIVPAAKPPAPKEPCQVEQPVPVSVVPGGVIEVSDDDWNLDRAAAINDEVVA